MNVFTDPANQDLYLTGFWWILRLTVASAVCSRQQIPRETVFRDRAGHVHADAVVEEVQRFGLCPRATVRYIIGV